MTLEETIILEIVIDKYNEKGVFIAKEMLSTLYDVLSVEPKSLIPNFRKRPIFRFFVVHSTGRIRFFFETPKKHKEFLESQLYAHYNNIEISESTLPFDDNTEFFAQESHLSKISEKLIKLYINLKDRTEKEAIDPLSSITSVLSHSEKDETAFFRVDFSPLEDESFRTDKAKSIISANISDSRKIFRLKHGWWTQFFLWPFWLLVAFLKILLGKTENSVTTTGSTEDTTEEEKFATFGYSTRLIMASTRQNRTRELSGGLTIFSSPNGAKFVPQKTKKKKYSETLGAYSPFKSILSVTELA